MTMTGKNKRTHRKTCHSAILSHTNPTMTGQRVKPGLKSDRPDYGTA